MCNLPLFMALALAAQPPSVAVVIEPVANMYSAPSADSDVVSQALYGNSVELEEEKEGWARIRTPDEYSGWMQLTALRRYESPDRPYASIGTTVEVASLFANVYREPNVTRHAPLLTLPFESKLEVSSEAEDRRWIEVRLPDGRAAWIQRGDVDENPRTLSDRATVSFAKRFLGLTYLWGGTSTFGYDCSGFTQMLVRRRGVLMPRDADLQAAWTGVTSVDRRKLRAGDLLFFGESPQKITHTGMWIGHGKFIHDTTHGQPGVQISRLRDQPWTKLLVACRRPK